MISRQDSLGHALAQIENGTLRDVSTIVFSRRWWEALPAEERDGLRARAAQVGVILRSDSELTTHFVEVRGSGPGLTTERGI